MLDYSTSNVYSTWRVETKKDFFFFLHNKMCVQIDGPELVGGFARLQILEPPTPFSFNIFNCAIYFYGVIKVPAASGFWFQKGKM